MKLPENGFYVYILRCQDDSLYTGWTTDIEKRLLTHNSGKGARYTRTRLPVSLVYFERNESKAVAMRREWKIKQLSRKEKLALILNDSRKQIEESPCFSLVVREIF